jgi:hypothetical protein
VAEARPAGEPRPARVPSGCCTIELAPVGDRALIEIATEARDADGRPLWQERFLIPVKDLTKLVARGQQVLAALR